MPDPNSIGQDRTYQDASDAYKAEKGDYTENVTTGDTEQRLPTQQLPKAPDPAPFNLGPVPTSSGR